MAAIALKVLKIFLSSKIWFYCQFCLFCSGLEKKKRKLIAYLPAIRTQFSVYQGTYSKSNSHGTKDRKAKTLLKIATVTLVLVG